MEEDREIKGGREEVKSERPALSKHRARRMGERLAVGRHLVGARPNLVDAMVLSGCRINSSLTNND
jgi:hypothetical protein